MLEKIADSISDVSKNEIKYVKKAFDWMDEAIEYMEKKNLEILSEKQISKLDGEISSCIRLLEGQLIELYQYEITYESFEKYVEDKRYLEILKTAYELHPHRFDEGKTQSLLRLERKPLASKRSAKKELEKWVKAYKENNGFMVNLLFSKSINQQAEEAIYKIRDWLINDFDALVDKIEPVRQEYIITRKGEVEPEEVDEYLASLFEEFDIYNKFVYSRSTFDFVYYPDLKI